MYGVQAGFGFGKVIELRGIWERSLDLKQNFGKYQSDIQSLFPTFNLEDRNIKVNRWGGEFKANIPARGFAPYFVLGTGVQNFKTELASGVTYKNENLYGSGGLGLKFSLGDRTTFNLEGRGIVYNMNPASLLYNEGGSSQFDDWISNTNRNTMYNWSVMAGLQFYLGGRKSDDMDDLDRAYLSRYSGGLSGAKLTITPAASYVNFNDKTAFRDTYMMGGIVGIDFSHYTGLQAYYYKATKDEKFQFDFDDLEMYGADFVGKLNVPRGIVPFISVGGGYLNVGDSYQGKPIIANNGTVNGIMKTSSGYFAKGGVGVSIPLSSYVEVFGSANLMFTMQDQSAKVEDLQSTNQLHQSSMYSAGLRLNIGKRANTDKAVNRAFDRRFESERTAYDAQVAGLEKELKEAYKNNDSEKVMKIMKEKKEADSVVKISTNTTTNQQLIRLTPAELESLIDKVLKGVDKQSELTVDDRLKRIEQLLMMGNMPQQPIIVGTDRTLVTPQQQNNTIDENLLKELRQLKQDLEIQKRQNLVQPQRDTVIINQTTKSTDPITVNPNHQKETIVLGASDALPQRFTPYIGVNFGDATTFNLGLRRYYAIPDTKIMFVPEAYIALGDGFGFGLSANGVIPFRTSVSGVTPYGGLGVGVHNLGSEFRFNTNILGGVALQVGSGKLTADYTIRGAFRNNQLAVGYSFSF
jgi:hypothetical protein